MQPTQSTQSTQSGQKRSTNDLNPATVGVIIAGIDNPLSEKIGEEILKRGARIACGLGKARTVKLQGNTVPVLDSTDAQLRTKLLDVTKGFETVVAVDCNANPNVDLLTNLGYPFVLATDQETSKALAKRANVPSVVDSNFSQDLHAFDVMFQDWSRRFPGLFEGWTLSGTECFPGPLTDFRKNTMSILDSFGTLTNNDDAGRDVARVRDPAEARKLGVPQQFLEGHAHQEFQLKSSSGSSTFTFKATINGQDDFASGVADSVMFLAHKVKENARAKMFSINDVVNARMRLGSYV